MGKLANPITGRGDDSLMFADHCLEIVDYFQRDGILGIAKTHVRTGVGTMLWNYHLKGEFGSISSQGASLN